MLKITDGVVFPDRHTVFGIQSADVETLIREYPCAKINNPLVDQNTRPDRPQRDHPAIPEYFLIAGTGPVLPD
ncbi:hypothetical protein ES703_37933 [subsurface metagenome]